MKIATNGCDTSFTNLKLFGIFSPHQQAVVDVVLQCAEAVDDLHVYATFGRLVGLNNQDIHLPVATECIITPSSNCEFKETLTFEEAEVRLPLLFSVTRDTWHWRSFKTRLLTETYYDDDSTVCLTHESDSQPASESQFYHIAPLGHVFIYIPKSSLHIRVSCISRKRCSIPQDGASPLESCTERILQSWKAFPPWSKRKDFPWTLTKTKYRIRAVTAIENHHHGEINDNLLNYFDDKECSTSLRLYADRHYLRHHLKKYALGECHGVKRIVYDMLYHARSIAYFLQSNNNDTSLGKYYYPAFLGDIASITRRHYNLKRIGTAAQSRIESLRRLNNEAKRFLIQSYVPEGSAVLDLACGHGQDVLKYMNKRLKRFVGIDISSEEIKEATTRMGQSSTSNKLGTECQWEFYVGNLLQENCYERISDEQFDVISIQLAIHYCLQNEDTADKLLMRISKHLKPGGVFLGSTGCCDTIAARLWQKCLATTTAASSSSQNDKNFNQSSDIKDYSFGNDVYRVAFSQEMLQMALGLNSETYNNVFSNNEQLESYLTSNNNNVENNLKKNLNTLWGIQYYFHLIEHIDALEFVVPWESFCSTAAKYGLKFIQHETFDGLLAMGDRFSDELQRWKHHNLGRLQFSDDQLEVFSFYKAFAFSKGPLKYAPKWLTPPPSISNTTTDIKEKNDVMLNLPTLVNENPPISHSLISSSPPPPPSTINTTTTVVLSDSLITPCLNTTTSMMETQTMNATTMMNNTTITTPPPLLQTPPPPDCITHDKRNVFADDDDDDDDSSSSVSSSSSSVSSSSSSSSLSSSLSEKIT